MAKMELTSNLCYGFRLDDRKGITRSLTIKDKDGRHKRRPLTYGGQL
jgi:hypothetical protein